MNMRVFDSGTVQIISFHAVEASKDKEPLFIQDLSLMESSGGRRDIK